MIAKFLASIYWKKKEDPQYILIKKQKKQEQVNVKRNLKPCLCDILKQLFGNEHINISMLRVDNHLIEEGYVLIQLNDHSDFRFDLLQQLNCSSLNKTNFISQRN